MELDKVPWRRLPLSHHFREEEGVGYQTGCCWQSRLWGFASGKYDVRCAPPVVLAV